MSAEIINLKARKRARKKAAAVSGRTLKSGTTWFPRRDEIDEPEDRYTLTDIFEHLSAEGRKELMKQAYRIHSNEICAGR